MTVLHKINNEITLINLLFLPYVLNIVSSEPNFHLNYML